MPASDEDVRCPGCGRLLAKRRDDDGAFEVAARGQLRAIVLCGEVYCSRCERTVGVQVCAARDKDRRLLTW